MNFEPFKECVITQKAGQSIPYFRVKKSTINADNMQVLAYSVNNMKNT